MHVVVMPVFGNEGEDLNWIPWMVIGHKDTSRLTEKVLQKVINEFDLTVDRDDAQYGQNEYTANLFLAFAKEKGYTVFPLTRLQWCVPNN